MEMTVQEYHSRQGTTYEDIKMWRERNKRALEKISCRTQLFSEETLGEYIRFLWNNLNIFGGFYVTVGTLSGDGDDAMCEFLIHSDSRAVTINSFGELEGYSYLAGTIDGREIIILYQEVLRIIEVLNFKTFPVGSIVRLKKNKYYHRIKGRLQSRGKTRNEFVVKDTPNVTSGPASRGDSIDNIQYTCVEIIATGAEYWLESRELMTLNRTLSDIQEEIEREQEEIIKRGIRNMAYGALEEQRDIYLASYRDAIKIAVTEYRKYDSTTADERVDTYYNNLKRGVERISEHVMCEEVFVNDGMLVKVVTKDIVCNHEEGDALWYCGKYEISIDLSRKNVRGCTVYDISETPHPHLNRAGNFCMGGQVAPVVGVAMAQLKPDVVFAALIELLQSFSDRNPYAPMPVVDTYLRVSENFIRDRDAFVAANPQIILANAS